jgi:regulatory protein
MKITALKLQARDRLRVNVYLDGKFAFGLAKVEAARLRLGQEIGDADLARLKSADAREKVHARALRLLARRPRSEVEVREHLQKHGAAEAEIAQELDRLRQSGLVDDQAFARLWVENRAAFRPRSKRALQVELKRKGITADMTAQALATADDADNAYRLAVARARRLAARPHPEFRRKLGDYLARRGFDYETIAPLVERVWRETQAERDD